MARQTKDGSWTGTDPKAAKHAYPTNTRHTPAAGVFDWNEVDHGLLARAVDTVTKRGHAISFALNRSGTTGCVTILAGDERPKYYCETLDEADDLLGQLAGES